MADFDGLLHLYPDMFRSILSALFYGLSAFYLLTTISSCQESTPSFSGIWIIHELNTPEDGNIIDCFKSDKLIIREDGTYIFPGFDDPLADGYYQLLDDNNIALNSHKDCYFRGYYTIRLEGENIFLESDACKIVGKEAVFNKNGHMDIDFFSRFLNKDLWETNSCQAIRSKYCVMDAGLPGLPSCSVSADRSGCD